MKKIFYICAVICAATIMVGCEKSDNNSPSDVYYSGMPWQRVEEYVYKGHDYIKFSALYEGASVHNPECRNEQCVKMRRMIDHLDSLENNK